MRLKKIEIHGFKSFANKITLEFHDGITGIVGPNGSGKSNIADAVRWVLGEQSAKQLRGSRMEDVIFSGTETRRPLGYAFVSITMDNSDHKLPIEYDEVTVTRRVYRSGESEYLINGSICRLRDVQELFMDTGIGKEGYSIIGQGQIDKILSGKPDDRRELFDEAAGIVKFKRRKTIAEKNLEEERLNLSRIKDILNEIDKQLGPLEAQSATAKVYLKLRDELKNLEINQFVKEYDKLKEAKLQLIENLSIATSDYEQTKLDYENTKNEYDKLELQLEEINQTIEGHRNTHNELKLQKEKHEGEIKLLSEQISSILKNDEYYQSRIKTNREEIEAKEAEEKKYLSDITTIDENVNSVESLLTQAQEELDRVRENISRYTKEIEECNNSIFEFLNTNSSIKTSLQRYETMLEQNSIRKAELNQKLIKNKSEECLYTEAIDNYKNSLQIISEDITRITNESNKLEQAIVDTQKRIDNITIEGNERQRQYLSEQSRLETLINMTERYDGYGNSIRKVMEKKSVMPGIVGVVADIIKTDKDYETAIETALGGTIQNIVTEDEETAKELIVYLKKNKFGRATFLPLTNISSNSNLHNDKVLNEPGVIGIAANLVKADSKYKDLISYLLGRILVVDHIDNATIIARKYRYTLRIVTLDGELLTPGGSISGGAYKNASNLLGRRREIDDAVKYTASLKNQLNELLEKKEEEKERKNSLRAHLEALKQTLQAKFLEQNTAKMNLELEYSKKKEAELALAEFAEELKNIEIQSKELADNIEELKNNLEQNAGKNSEIENHIELINKQLEEERIKEVEYSDKVSKLKMELSSLGQNRQFMLENVRRIKGDIEKLLEEEVTLKEDILKASQLVEEKKLAINNTREIIEGLDKTANELEEKIRENINQRDSINLKHKNFFSKREELSNRMNELDKECYRLNSQIEKLTEQADGQINYMWDEYEITYNTALSYPIDHELSLPQIKKAIVNIKGKIKELGDVNVNSIEDFKKLSERYEFLKTQEEDLVQSEEALKMIIEELDTEMRKQFAEKFEEINKQFEIVFKELFGGGKASVELMEGEDVLEAGILINVQPPGKKLQNIMQLSGGEKALTAISLLFAIQNLKPSPFCLLDEIEAALDDSNVYRYAKYLNKLKKDTQFIIITHRRGTMAAADILYGITMQEKGVSTLVSVNLIENQLDK